MLCHTDPAVVSVPYIWKASPSHSSVGRCMAPSLLSKLPLQSVESLLGSIWGTGAFENVDIAEFLYYSWCFSVSNSFLKRRLKHLHSLWGRKCLFPFGGTTEPGITPWKCVCGWEMSLVERGWVMVGHLLQPGQHNHCFQRDAKTSSYIFFQVEKKSFLRALGINCLFFRYARRRWSCTSTTCRAKWLILYSISLTYVYFLLSKHNNSRLRSRFKMETEVWQRG